MLRNHSDLMNGEVYLFQNSQVVYGLNSETAQYSNQLKGFDKHVFTAWPIAPGRSRSVFLGGAEVDEMIRKGELTGPV